MATIQGIYLALFGRPADPAGLAYFNGVTNNGANLAAIGNLAGQPEYTARFTGMTNTQIINSIYQSLFGRDGETAGINFWVDKLTSGSLNINNIAIAILDGAQGADKATIDAKIAAANLFTTHLDLPAEQSAYNNTTATLIKNYIATINTTKAGTDADVDALIQQMMTSGGQAPGGGGGGGGGGEGEGPVNHPAAITGTITGDVIEDGEIGKPEIKKAALVEDAYTGIATGSLTALDPDGTEGFTAATLNGTYGSLIIDAVGNWTYTIDSTLDVVQKLQEKQIVEDVITVHSADGTPQDITISVHGVNDEATFIDNAESYTVVEDKASGTVTVSDIDSDETFGAASGTVGTYGNFTFTSTENGGKWTYELAADGAQKADYEALPDGEKATETLTVTAADGTSHEIVVNLTGVNDAATFTNTVAENGRSGTVKVADVDTGEAKFDTATPVDTAKYGSFGFVVGEDGVGTWTYTAATSGDKKAAFDALAAGVKATETLTVYSFDKTPNVIAVDVTGVNDDPKVTTLITDQKLNTGVAFTLDASASFTDPDTGDTLTYTAKEVYKDYRGVEKERDLPTWLKLDASTGKFSGIATDGAAITVKVTVKDVAGASATDTFKLDVAAVHTTYDLRPGAVNDIKGFSASVVYDSGNRDYLKIAGSDASANLADWGGIGWDEYANWYTKADGKALNLAYSGSNWGGIWEFSEKGIIEFNVTLNSSADLEKDVTDTSTATELFKGLRNNSSPLETINVSSGWKGFLVAYDNGNAYVYHASAGTGDSNLTSNEVHLVGVVRGVTDLDVSNFTL